MKRVITSLSLLLLLLCGVQAQEITQYEYWTDDDYAGRSVASYAGGDISLSISTEQLSAGIHYLNFRAMRSDDVWGNYWRYLYYIPTTSSAQNTEAGNMTLEYWLDDNIVDKGSKAVGDGNVSLAIDISSLSPGVHYFNCTPITESGERGSSWRYMFYVPTAADQTTVAEVSGFEYWLDDDYAGKAVSSSTGGEALLSISIDGLGSGIHYFNCRAYNERGEYGSLVRELFYIPQTTTTTADADIAGGEYWLDDDYVGKVSITSSDTQQAFTIDISQLKSGVHYFNYRAVDTEGRYGNYVREMFYIPQTDANAVTEATLAKAEYWLDDDYDNKVEVETAETQQAFTIDVSQLKSGVHYFNYRAIDSEGRYGNYVRQLFYMAQQDIASTYEGEWMEYECWIDDDTDHKVTGSGIMKDYMVSLDISGLDYGDHTFNFRAKNVADQWTEVYTETFNVDWDVNIENIVFADANVKAVCTANWDKNGNGELSTQEAALVEDLGDAFAGNRDITSFDELRYFTGLTEIADDAFNGCYALTSVTIPDNVERIGNSAFMGCFGLTEVEISESITSIGEGAFNYCSSLTKVKVGHSEPLPIESSTFSNRQNALLYVPTGCKAAFMAADYWKEFMAIIEVKTGDTNGDGNISIADVTALVGHLAGRPPRIFVVEAADANYDGEVNIADAMTIVKNILKGNNEIVPEPKFYYSVGTEEVTANNYTTANGAQYKSSLAEIPETLDLSAISQQQAVILLPEGCLPMIRSASGLVGTTSVSLGNGYMVYTTTSAINGSECTCTVYK